MADTTTQQFLEIDKIKEGTVVLKNKALRGIIMVSSVNFALKSEEEQNATLYQFQAFLNSLDFSVEIVIQSRRLNITGYLDKLKDLGEKQEIELLKIQTEDYRKFIKELIGGGSIMSKSFFAVVPFSLIEMPGFSHKKGPAAKEAAAELSQERFQQAKSQLWQRMEFVGQGLRRCGLQCVPLNTNELIELFWSLYNPEEAEVGYYPEIPPEITA